MCKWIAVSQPRSIAWTYAVSKWDLKTTKLYNDVTLDGIVFHTCAAATRTARPPVVARRTRGLTRSAVDTELIRCRLSVSATQWNSQARYDGARPDHWATRRSALLSWSLSVKRSQCSSRRSGVTWSNLRDMNIKRAAALRTDCSLTRDWSVIPESVAFPLSKRVCTSATTSDCMTGLWDRTTYTVKKT